jgi:hypothetical protein
MTEQKYQQVKGGLIKKTKRRVVGVFIDGIGLDRATRRLNRRIDLAALIKGVTSGLAPTLARYYTVVPHEDDSRHRSFLDAVSRAGLNVIVKRLPPKGITRQVTTDIEMSTDIVAYALGLSSFNKAFEYLPAEMQAVKNMSVGGAKATISPADISESKRQSGPLLNIDPQKADITRSLIVICPTRELSYAMTLAKDLGADTTTADFGKFNKGDVLKSASKWIDLSDSETIWKD